MKRFAIAIEYLTGYSVATDHTDRSKPEWPPHPARVFMALAAAHFETDSSPEAKHTERDALEWLAALGDPSLALPKQAQSQYVSPRESLTVYVPVNDSTDIGVLPTKRSRQPRMFPRMYVGDEPIRLIWSHDDDDAHLEALESICRNVTRIGHSSSLVWVRVERDVPVPPTHIADENLTERGLRIVQGGALGRLEKLFNRSEIEAYAVVEQQVEAAKGAARKALKTRLENEFPKGKPTSQRPIISLSRGYRSVTPEAPMDYASVFDPSFIVLSESEDATQTFGLESTAQLTNALRNLVMRESGIQTVPPWISGHEPNGDRLRSSAHIATVPLAFVGSDYADGHLMGLGILIPRDVPHADRAKGLSKLLFGENNEPRTLELKLGRAGNWRVIRETGFSPKKMLQPQTYTTASHSWASVTPVVLDRMPKSDRVDSPVEWREEVAGIIASSCMNIGLPEPVTIRVEKTPFLKGSLRAMPGQGGFPLLRNGTFQVHLQIEFDRPVGGPLLIGAGRFRGYGLMRPWKREVGQ